MANSTQTSIGGVPELIDAICTFALANGWTIHRNSISSGLRVATLSIAGVTDYIHLFNASASDDILRGRISIDYDGGLAPEDQDKVTAEDTLCDIRTGPIPKTWMFANGTALHIVNAISVNSQYRHIVLGLLDKTGAYAGGTYLDMSYHPTGNYENLQSNYGTHAVLSTVPQGNTAIGSVRADCTLDGRADFFHGFSAQRGESLGASTQYPYSDAHSAGLAGRLIKCADQNTFSGRSVFQPIRVFVRRTGSPSYSSPAGVVVGSRWASLNKFNPETEVVIGGDTWQIFPLAKKRPETSTYYPAGVEIVSGDFGVAVLKSP